MKWILVLAAASLSLAVQAETPPTRDDVRAAIEKAAAPKPCKRMLQEQKPDIPPGSWEKQGYPNQDPMSYQQVDCDLSSVEKPLTATKP